ncbi:ABC transporter ATP-binding protein [Rhodoferax sediminis]|uniref:ABC transporter ATP-binding protein n=2 Tax=Rhodoferax sediminis TaxID=2509614 RepID=A0A515DH44_9BURK|nr:ABC transporter ATP-binding protein [Rhodoferax sediminis]
MLVVEDVVTAYGQIVALNGVSLEVHDGDVVCLLGANGAGKSTLINTISGILRPRSGCVVFQGENVVGLKASRITDRGIVQVPEGRGIFTQMTVHENLLMGAHLRRDTAGVQSDIDAAYARFPVLAERRAQKAGVLSGGEQQMLALERALLSQPKLLLLDEPSMGLSPIMVERVFDNIRQIAATGVTILLVEQNAQLALEISSRAYVLQNGEMTMSGSASELLQSDLVQDAYLGAA